MGNSLSNMSKIKSATPIEKIEKNEDKWRCTFSFEIESEDGLRNSKINAKATGEGVRKVCHEVSRDDSERLLECWYEKVKALWLSLDEEFVFSKDSHDYEDYSDSSDFERLSQRSNDGNYPL